MNTTAATILKQTARNMLTIASTLCIAAGAFLLYVTPGLDLWHNGRLTDLGALTVVPAVILAVFGVLWIIAPHLEALYGPAAD